MIKNINRVNYVTSTKYISGVIEEYDIAKANINMLLVAGKIDKKTYDFLYNADKQYREVYIGKLIKDDKSYDTVIKKGLIYYKDLFYQANSIEDDNIVSIHNDSIYVLNKPITATVFDDFVNFKFKGKYIAFWKIFSLEIYYYYDLISSVERIEIKGINDEKLSLHELYFIEFLKTLFLERETNGLEACLDLLKTFTRNYLDKSLDPNYYREFNPSSLFNFGRGYYSKYCLPNQVQYLDITYNNYILREIFSILSIDYFSKNKPGA